MNDIIKLILWLCVSGLIAYAGYQIAIIRLKMKEQKEYKKHKRNVSYGYKPRD